MSAAPHAIPASHPPHNAQYLVRARKPKVAHLWLGEDTRCKMASTGGLELAHYTIVTQTGLPVCAMCRDLAAADAERAGFAG